MTKHHFDKSFTRQVLACTGVGLLAVGAVMLRAAVEAKLAKTSLDSYCRGLEAGKAHERAKAAENSEVLNNV